MKYFLLSLSLLSLSAYPGIEPSIDCGPVDEAFGFFGGLSWSAASDKQIKKAPCKTAAAPKMETIQTLINSKAGNEKADDTVYGVEFKNESPELIKMFKELTTYRDYLDLRELPLDQKDIQAEYQINPACDKVMCAMEKIWGQELAYKISYIKLKHQFNTSELAFQDSSRFTVDEINNVIIGLDDLPAHLVPAGKSNQRLTHYTRGKTLPEYGEGDRTVANAVVMIFDRWDDDSPSSKQYTVFHEMAHNISHNSHDLDGSPEWLNLSNWIKKGNDWSADTGACFISRYAQDSPWEDFAETVSSYRYNAKKLKKNCPEKYAFLKDKVFNGIEYTDSKLCLK